MRLALRKLPVQVIPASLLAHEATDLVHALRLATAVAQARYELHRGVLAFFLMPFDVQPQPRGFRMLRRQLQAGGAGAGVPGGQQIILAFEHISTVTRAHQSFGGECKGAFMQRTATVRVTGVIAAGAGREGVDSLQGRDPEKTTVPIVLHTRTNASGI